MDKRTLFTLLLFSLLLVSPKKGLADSSEDVQGQLRRATSRSLQTLQHLEEMTRSASPCAPSTHHRFCPELLLNSLEDIYDEGWVLGKVDRLFNEGRFKNPRSTCSLAAREVEDAEPRILAEQLSENYSSNFQYQDYPFNCREKFQDIGVPPEDIKLAQNYLQTDFNAKNEMAKRKISQLLASKSQIRQSLNEPLSHCESYEGFAREKCQEQLECQKELPSLLETKKRQLQVATEGLQKLYQKRDQLNERYRGRMRQLKRDEFEKVREGIETLKNIHPILKSESFSEINEKVEEQESISESTLETGLRDYFQKTEDDLDQKISEAQNARACLNGGSPDCDEAEEFFKNETFRDTSQVFLDEENRSYTELNRAHNLYQCLENQKKSHEETDEILTDSAVGAALTVTPMGALSAIKAAQRAGKLIQSASQANRATRGVEVATGAADLAYGGYHTQKIYQDCQRSQEALVSNTEEGSRSCQQQEQAQFAASNSSQCATQVIVSAALMAPVGLQALKLFRMQNRATTAAASSRQSIPVDEIMANSRLSDAQRAQKAADVLNLSNLSSQQREALLRAHNFGDNGVFTYTQGELRRKAEILRESFSQQEASILMRRGLAGRPVDEPFVFTKTLDEFHDGLMGGVHRVQNEYSQLLPKVLNSDKNLDKLTIAHEHIKRQIGKGHIRALKPDEIEQIVQDGKIPSANFFSHKGSGAHVGHNGSMIYVRCKQNCDKYFGANPSSSTGSGVENIESIPLEDLELVVPDVRAAAQSAGLEHLMEAP